MSEQDKDFKIDESLLINGLKFWLSERYANKTDEEIMSDYSMLCALTVHNMKTAGDERIDMIEDTLRPIKDLMKS